MRIFKFRTIICLGIFAAILIFAFKNLEESGRRNIKTDRTLVLTDVSVREAHFKGKVKINKDGHFTDVATGAKFTYPLTENMYADYLKDTDRQMTVVMPVANHLIEGSAPGPVLGMGSLLLVCISFFALVFI